MDKIKVNLLQEDILKKPRGKVLLLPKFKDKDGDNLLFNKLDQNLGKRLSNRAEEVGFKSGENEQFIFFGAQDKIGYEAILVFGIGEKKDFTSSILLKAVGSALRRIASEKLKSASIQIDSSLLSGKISEFEMGKLLSEALYLSQYQFLKYKSEESRNKIVTVNELNIYCSQMSNVKCQMLRDGIDLGRLVCEGVYLARNLVNDPAEHVSPDSLASEAIRIAKESKGTIKVKIIEEDECRKLGMGAFLGVARGSHRKPKFAVLSYFGKGKEAGLGKVKSKKICLIGKSITFDSGGLSLKPSKGMETMKIDMAGGATVLGVFEILSKNKIDVPHEIFGILPACENMPGGGAMRPGDVVKALNGKTIEVLNTDAEGRLALADALSYAEKNLKPDIIIDLATLTGAVMVALGADVTGLMGNDENLIKSIKNAADKESEPIWPLPLYKDYLEGMKSDIADIKNISGIPYGGAIKAGLFLQEFVKNTKWVHLDIAGASFNEGKIHDIIPKGATGWGVRMLIKWLVSSKL